MPIINRVAAMADEIASWRRDFHENPELLFDVHRTAGIVAGKLKEFGCDEVVTGIGRTGVVGVIMGKTTASGKVIGLRADMDALPIEEADDVSLPSKVPGKMHACGHDGHTAMLLGAAKYLAETRNFDGTAVMIFQPAEEGGGGGDAMVKDGLMERFGFQEVYGLHNMPGIPVGLLRDPARTDDGGGGPVHADDRRQGRPCGAAARMHRHDRRRGACRHGAPDDRRAQCRSARSAVISVCAVKAGDTFNVIPQTATLLGTVRTLKEEVQDLCEARIRAVVDNVCAAFGAKAPWSTAGATR